MINNIYKNTQKIIHLITKNIPKRESIKYLKNTQLTYLPSDTINLNEINKSEVMPILTKAKAQGILLNQIFSSLNKVFIGKKQEEINKIFTQNQNIKKLYEIYKKSGKSAITQEIIKNLNKHVGEKGVKKTSEITETNLKNIKKWWRDIFLKKKQYSPQEKAKIRLTELYNNILNDSSTSDKRKTAYLTYKEQINALTLEILYKRLFDEEYNKLRRANYPKNYSENIAEKTAKGSRKILVINQNRWHFRLPKNKPTDSTIKYRISINAQDNEKLIDKLDKIIIHNQKGYYKTPEDKWQWLNRHDPITIYLYEKPDEKLIKTLVSKCKKYIRSTNNVLVGEKFIKNINANKDSEKYYKGFALQKNPDSDDFQKLLKELEGIDPVAEKAIRNCLNRGNNNPRGSAGEYYALEKMINYLK